MLKKELLNLQNKEIELIRIETKIKNLEREKEELEKKMDSLKSKILSAQEKLKEKKEAIKELKNFIDYKKERIEELEKQKESAKNREEYKKILRLIAKNEDEIIKTKQQINSLETEAEALEEAYKKVFFNLQPQIETITGELEDLQKDILVLEKKKGNVKAEIEKIKKDIPKEEIEKFEEYKNKFNGLVFSDVSSGSCEGCGMSYSSAEYRELLKNLEPGRSKCPYCGGFIYLKNSK